MKIQILVNHYKENQESVKNFLDSLNLQKNADFEVLICSDGDKQIDIKNFFGKYKYKIYYAYNQHTGVCQTRNILLNKSNTEYVMFCDIDDMFIREDGLESLIKVAEETKADIIESPYISENQNYQYITVYNDNLRVHGKLFKREYLISNNIFFPPEMESSGDMMFLWLAYSLTKNIQKIDNIFYLWKWNPNSVTRQNKYYGFKTYDRTLKCYTLLLKDLIKRQRLDLYENALVAVIGMIYIDLSHPMYTLIPKEYRDNTEKSIKKFLQSYYTDYKKININKRKQGYLVQSNYMDKNKIAGKFENLIPFLDNFLKKESATLTIGNTTITEKQLQALLAMLSQ